GARLGTRGQPPGKRMACPICARVHVVPAEPHDEPPDDDSDRTPARQPTAANDTCPSCDRPLKPDAVLCVEGGFELRTGKKRGGPTAPRRKKSRDEPEEIKDRDLRDAVEAARGLCRLCWARLSPDADRCHYCGTVPGPVLDRDVRAMRLTLQQI